MDTRVEKVTISLPRDLVTLTDKIARERRISRSRVISACLREFGERQIRAEMEEGYMAMAEEQRELAGMVFELQSKVVPEWK